MNTLKHDKFRDNRGGYSRILNIICEHCGNHICYYQKDGPGSLRRMYVDRMLDTIPSSEKLLCKLCGRELGVRIIYEKENRRAYRLFVDAVIKKVVAQKTVEL